MRVISLQNLMLVKKESSRARAVVHYGALLVPLQEIFSGSGHYRIAIWWQPDRKQVAKLSLG